VSTLNEIAANHARMAKEKEAQAIGSGERQLQIVGSFEISSAELPQPVVPLHLVAGVQDNNLGQVGGYLI
jgi:hypothetical protein